MEPSCLGKLTLQSQPSRTGAHHTHCVCICIGKLVQTTSSGACHCLPQARSAELVMVQGKGCMRCMVMVTCMLSAPWVHDVHPCGVTANCRNLFGTWLPYLALLLLLSPSLLPLLSFPLPLLLQRYSCTHFRPYFSPSGVTNTHVEVL